VEFDLVCQGFKAVGPDWNSPSAIFLIAIRSRFGGMEFITALGDILISSFPAL
jgi:hypothetical protein